MLDLASIAFNRPRAIREQVRLLDRFLGDEFELTVYDNSTDEAAAAEIAEACSARTLHEVRYERLRVEGSMHHLGLNYAAARLLERGASHVGFLDHDVFPTAPTSLVELIDRAGFYGVPQRHPPTGRLYLWPGFCFLSRAWLAGRPLDLSGIRSGNPREDGDTGSAAWPLFSEEDWARYEHPVFGYRQVRPVDGVGLQSWGVEQFGDWLHFTNESGWKAVPDREERDRLTYGLLEVL